eukprot:g9170.t1
MIPSMSKAGEQVALMTGSRPPVNFEVEFRERIVQWRDFPSPGLLTLVEIPFDEESQTFVSQSGGHFATVTVVEPHPQNSDQMIAQSIAQMIHVSAASFQNIELLAEADADFYSVLSLRTCPQGRPLLPGALPEHVLNPNEDPWCVVLDLPEEVEYKLSFWFRPFGEFNFPNYLFLFLAAIGCAEVQVFNSMDGRLLVPYQAVVRRAQWMSVAKRFDAAWKLHKMAYRKLNGTKHAPTISEACDPTLIDAKTPRFAEVSDDIRDNPPSIPLKSLITVHNTFIEVDDVPEAPPGCGGETAFPHLGFQVRPAKHTAVMWHNRTACGEGDMRLKHEAKPVLDGIKYGMNCFVNLHPQRDASNVTVYQQTEDGDPVKWRMEVAQADVAGVKPTETQSEIHPNDSSRQPEVIEAPATAAAPTDSVGFGRHGGMTYEELWIKEPQYCLWVITTFRQQVAEGSEEATPWKEGERPMKRFAQWDMELIEVPNTRSLKERAGPEKKSKFYGVAKPEPRICTSWEECKQYVHGVKGVVYRSFATREEAEEFVKNPPALTKMKKRAPDDLNGEAPKKTKNKSDPSGDEALAPDGGDGESPRPRRAAKSTAKESAIGGQEDAEKEGKSAKPSKAKSKQSCKM